MDSLGSATPYFPYVPEKTESGTGHPLKWQSPEIAAPKNFGEFRGGKLWTLPGFRGGKF